MILPLINHDETVKVDEQLYTIYQRIDASTNRITNSPAAEDIFQFVANYNLYSELAQNNPLIIIFRIQRYISNIGLDKVNSTSLTATFTEENGETTVNMHVRTNPVYMIGYTVIAALFVFSLLGHQSVVLYYILILLIIAGLDVFSKIRIRNNVRDLFVGGK